MTLWSNCDLESRTLLFLLLGSNPGMSNDTSKPKIIEGPYGSDNPLQTPEVERTPNSGDGKPLSTCPRNYKFLMEILNKIRDLRSEEKF